MIGGDVGMTTSPEHVRMTDLQAIHEPLWDPSRMTYRGSRFERARMHVERPRLQTSAQSQGTATLTATGQTVNRNQQPLNLQAQSFVTPL